MQHKINIIPESFDFISKDNFDELFLGMRSSDQFIEQTHSAFCHFSLSVDFYSCLDLINQNYNTDEAGLLLRSLCDGIGRRASSNLETNQVIELIEQQANLPSEYNTLYVDNKNARVTSVKTFFIRNEETLLNHCCEYLKQHPAEPTLYGQNITLTFKNLIFHPNFNQLPNIEGGYKNFVGEIINFLRTANDFEQSENNVDEDIKKLHSSSLYEVCEEGGGKSKNTAKRLFFDYQINNRSIILNNEFHYKLTYADGQHRIGHRYGNRIYFGFLKSTKPMKITIAHIGGHL